MVHSFGPPRCCHRARFADGAGARRREEEKEKRSAHGAANQRNAANAPRKNANLKRSGLAANLKRSAPEDAGVNYVLLEGPILIFNAYSTIKIGNK